MVTQPINYISLILLTIVIFTLSIIYLLQKSGQLQKLLGLNHEGREGLSSYINSTEVPKYFEYNNARYPIIEILKTTQDKFGGWEGKITYSDNTGSLNSISITDKEFEINKEPENIMNDNIILKFMGEGEQSSNSQTINNLQTEKQILKSRIIVLQEQIQDMIISNKAQLMREEQEKGAIHGSRTITGFGGGISYDNINKNIHNNEEQEDQEEDDFER